MPEKKIVIYSQPGCSFCHMAKSFLDKKGIEYTDINIQEDQEAMRKVVEEYKAMSTPVIVVGDEVIQGFDRRRLEELLK